MHQKAPRLHVECDFVLLLLAHKCKVASSWLGASTFICLHVFINTDRGVKQQPWHHSQSDRNQWNLIVMAAQRVLLARAWLNILTSLHARTWLSSDPILRGVLFVLVVMMWGISVFCFCTAEAMRVALCCRGVSVVLIFTWRDYSKCSCIFRNHFLIVLLVEKLWNVSFSLF